jgi:cysteine synthase A
MSTACQPAPQSQLKHSVLEAIGNTPLVKLQKVVGKNMADVVVKLEYYNPTGSYKDRMALAMIEGAEKRGDLRPGVRVVEYTGGSTGSSLALVCSIKGYPFIAVSSDGFAREKLQTMKIFGADLRIIPSDQGKLTPELFRTMIDTAEKLGRQPNMFYCDQFHNEDAVEGYKSIGRELHQQVGQSMAAFCAAVGTAGMLVGVSRALKACGSQARISPSSPLPLPFSPPAREAHTGWKALPPASALRTCGMKISTKPARSRKKRRARWLTAWRARKAFSRALLPP